MKFLVDANVLREAMRPTPELQVLDWLSKNERFLAVNPVVLGEMEYGILLLPQSKRKKRLQMWFKGRSSKNLRFGFRCPQCFRLGKASCAT